MLMIQGFKKRKRPKTEKDLQMEWRKRLQEKQEKEAPMEIETVPKKTSANDEALIAQQRYRELKKARASGQQQIKPAKKESVVGPQSESQNKTKVSKVPTQPQNNQPKSTKPTVKPLRTGSIPKKFTFQSSQAK